MAKIKELKQKTIKGSGNEEVIYPITKANAVYCNNEGLTVAQTITDIWSAIGNVSDATKDTLRGTTNLLWDALGTKPQGFNKTIYKAVSDLQDVTADHASAINTIEETQIPNINNKIGTRVDPSTYPDTHQSVWSTIGGRLDDAADDDNSKDTLWGNIVAIYNTKADKEELDNAVNYVADYYQDQTVFENPTLQEAVKCMNEQLAGTDTIMGNQIIDINTSISNAINTVGEDLGLIPGTDIETLSDALHAIIEAMNQ